MDLTGGYKMGYAMKIIKKDAIIIFVMGALYMVLEGLWRGWTNISMLVVGGLCGFLIGKLNEQPDFYRKIWEQCLIGMLIVLVIEFISGMILNVFLQFGIWDYSNIWGNFYGQICIPYAILWFLLVPLVIYVDDYLRFRLFEEEEPQELLKNYKNLFLGR
jgi:uncharacterized membrane protein